MLKELDAATPATTTTPESRQQGPIVEIQDCSPIRHARIELRPLTVFVGRGNTGKSWTAALIYALHRHFGVQGRRLHRTTGAAETRIDEATKDGLRRIGNAIRGRAATTEKGGNAPIKPDEAVTNAVQEHVEREAEQAGAELQRCLGIGYIDELHGRMITTYPRIRLDHRIGGTEARTAHELTARDNGWRLTTRIPSGWTIPAGADIAAPIGLTALGQTDEHHAERAAIAALTNLAARLRTPRTTCRPTAPACSGPRTPSSAGC